MEEGRYCGKVRHYLSNPPEAAERQFLGSLGTGNIEKIRNHLGIFFALPLQKIENMNSYILSRQWFDFAFENGSKVKPIHGSLYFWIIELANRLGWPAEFGNPTSQCMLACGISSYNTYKKAFDELVEFGFVKVKRKSINQHTSCIIALSIIDKAQYKALDKALSEHSTKHSSSTVQSTDSINKPLTTKPETPSDAAAPALSFLEMFDACQKLYPGTKRGTETEFADLEKKYKKEFTADFFRKIYLGIQAKNKTNKELKQAGQFVPEWPHMKTYLHQRRWEEKTEVQVASAILPSPTLSAEEYHSLYGTLKNPQTEAA